jgi:hypothetical protein
VYINDAKTVAHLGVGRREDEPAEETRDDERKRRPADPRPADLEPTIHVRRRTELMKPNG